MASSEGVLKRNLKLKVKHRLVYGSPLTKHTNRCDKVTQYRKIIQRVNPRSKQDILDFFKAQDCNRLVKIAKPNTNTNINLVGILNPNGFSTSSKQLFNPARDNTPNIKMDQEHINGSDVDDSITFKNKADMGTANSKAGQDNLGATKHDEVSQAERCST